MPRPMASTNPPPAWREKQVLPQGILIDTLSLIAGPNSLSELGQFRLARGLLVFQEYPYLGVQPEDGTGGLPGLESGGVPGIPSGARTQGSLSVAGPVGAVSVPLTPWFEFLR